MPARLSRERVKSKMLPCEVCGRPVALLIIATGARSTADFADYARKMFHLYRDMNVPTWIIGDSLGVPGLSTPSCVMKVWPARENLCQVTPEDFNAELTGAGNTGGSGFPSPLFQRVTDQTQQ